MQKDDANFAQTEIEAHLTKNRIAAVDITRVMAAFIVMYSHMAVFGTGAISPHISKFLFFAGMGSVSPIFFVFAGYFACRKLTWKKAFYNAIWCLLPLELWNVITLVVRMIFEGGMDAVWALDGPESLSGKLLYHLVFRPLDGPLWFMRNLFFLFLLAPVIFKWSRWVLFALLFMMCYQSMAGYIVKANGTILYSLYFFAVGCFLRTFSEPTQKRILSYSSTPLILLYFGIAVLGQFLMTQHVIIVKSVMHSAVRETLGLWILYLIARWIELHFPSVTKVLVKVAPVTFLTFAVHWIVFYHLVPHIGNPIVLEFVPVATFLVLTAVFFSMKRWARPLLHLVAHYKLRPDDLKPTPDKV